MARVVISVLAACLTWGLVASPVVASVEASLDVQLRFEGSCDEHGLLVVTGAGPLRSEYEYAWGSNRDLVTTGTLLPLSPPVSIALVDDRGATLFEAVVPSEPPGSSAYRFHATLNCAHVPYRIVLPDTGTATTSTRGDVPDPRLPVGLLVPLVVAAYVARRLAARTAVD